MPGGSRGSATSARLIPIAAEQVKAAEDTLAQTDQGFRIGRAIQLDVLDAQNTLAQARLRYAQAVVRYNQSQVRILSALGLLDAACLAGGP